MNERFSINRFGALALKYYRENRKMNLVIIGIMFVTTFLCLCEFNPFMPEYTVTLTQSAKDAFVRHYQMMYTHTFWGLLLLFSMVAAARSFKWIVMPHKMMNALLLPASNFEKFLLGFLHSTWVVGIVYLLVFYATAWLVSSYKYAGVEQLELVKGALGMMVPDTAAGGGIVRPGVGNIFQLGSNPFLFQEEVESYKGVVWGGFIGIWLYVISIFMWGSVTFRKRVGILTVLLHFLVFLLVGYGLVRIAMAFSGRLEGLEDVGEVDIPSPYWSLFFYVFPLVYLFVTWLKLRYRQMKGRAFQRCDLWLVAVYVLLLVVFGGMLQYYYRQLTHPVTMTTVFRGDVQADMEEETVVFAEEEMKKG